jgi:hypothetical protein
MLVTYDHAPNAELLQQHYQNLPEKLQAQNIDPRIFSRVGFRRAPQRTSLAPRLLTPTPTVGAPPARGPGVGRDDPEATRSTETQPEELRTMTTAELTTVNGSNTAALRATRLTPLRQTRPKARPVGKPPLTGC